MIYWSKSQAYLDRVNSVSCNYFYLLLAHPFAKFVWLILNNWQNLSHWIAYRLIYYRRILSFKPWASTKGSGNCWKLFQHFRTVAPNRHFGMSYWTTAHQVSPHWSSHDPCSDKVGNKHNIQHVYHMKGGTSLPCKNYQTYVQETKDETRHNTMVGCPIYSLQV